MLTLEFLLLLHCVLVVLDEALCWRDIELRDATVIQLINCLVEGLWVDTLPLNFKLTVELSKLVLDGLCLDLELFVVEAVLRLAIDAKLYLILISRILNLVLASWRCVPCSFPLHLIVYLGGLSTR